MISLKLINYYGRWPQLCNQRCHLWMHNMNQYGYSTMINIHIFFTTIITLSRNLVNFHQDKVYERQMLAYQELFYLSSCKREIWMWHYMWQFQLQWTSWMKVWFFHKNIITSFNGQIHNKWAIAFLIHHNFVSWYFIIREINDWFELITTNGKITNDIKIVCNVR